MEKTIDAIVEGGKATPGPPLGPALGPLGVDTPAIIAKINEKTKDFAGMKVPVRITVDTKTKEWKIEIGSPPTAEIIKKEAGIQKGAATREAPSGDIAFDKVVKIAKQKSTNSFGKDFKAVVKEVVGTCVSMGITIDGKPPKDVIKEINKGKYDAALGV